MAKRPNAGELSRTIAGQWTKTEKRSAASRSITEANRNTHRILKAFRQQQHMR
jgi:hypothetical protein